VNAEKHEASVSKLQLRVLIVYPYDAALKFAKIPLEEYVTQG
jgi:hypothetical protein